MDMSPKTSGSNGGNFVILPNLDAEIWLSFANGICILKFHPFQGHLAKTVWVVPLDPEISPSKTPFIHGSNASEQFILPETNSKNCPLKINGRKIKFPVGAWPSRNEKKELLFPSFCAFPNSWQIFYNPTKENPPLLDCLVPSLPVFSHGETENAGTKRNSAARRASMAWRFRRIVLVWCRLAGRAEWRDTRRTDDTFAANYLACAFLNWEKHTWLKKICHQPWIKSKPSVQNVLPPSGLVAFPRKILIHRRLLPNAEYFGNLTVVLGRKIPWKKIGCIPSRELTYPTWGKGKSSSKCHFWGIC